MRTKDVTDTIELALAATGFNRAVIQHKPRPFSDNGSCYIFGEPADCLDEKKMNHFRGALFHPQTQVKSESWHQTIKKRDLLESYFLPDDFESQIEAFVEYFNNQRYHESLCNVTPADAYFGRDKPNLTGKKKIKKLTIQNIRLEHQKQAA